MPPPPPPPPPGPPLPPPPPAPMGVPAAAMDVGRLDLMQSLKGMGNKKMLKPVPRREKKHFNMIEMLKVEEKKKKGGIGVSTKAKTTSEPSTTAKVDNKPSASELLAVKLRKKENIEKRTVDRVSAVKTVETQSAVRCSTTDEELEALFSAIDKEITDDPEAALDLLDVLEDDPEASVEMQEEMEVIKSNIYLPPEDDYTMDVEEEVQDKEDEEMQEMLALIESAKGEIDTTKEEELLKMMDRLDDDEYFEKLKSDVIAEEKAKLEAEIKQDMEKQTSKITAEDESAKNKRRADESLPEKEPSKKKTKDSKKKKALAAGGVSIFGGKDLFGGKNPFASRKQEISSDEEEELEEDVDQSNVSSTTPSNGEHKLLPPPPPPPMPSINIALQPDCDEKPVSFDDLPTNSHVISSSNKNRATLPSKRRPPGRAGRQSNGHVTNGHSENTSDSDLGKLQTNETDDKTNKLTDRLALPSEENEYDGDVSEMSHSQVRRGRRSIKRKQPPKGGVALFGKADLFEGKNPFAHRRGDSEEKEVEHSERCDPSDNNSLTKKEAAEKERLERAKEEEDQRKREEERKTRLEQERKQEVERKIRKKQQKKRD